MRVVRTWIAVMLVATLVAVGAGRAGAQSLEGAGTVGTGLLLRQLGGVKRVLMIGAHPDDEDTSLLAALARGQGVQVAYLALTRGDGGQNLLGPELWEGLGIIRTGELEAARRLDGGRQFFTRAFDYGFSKSAAEAFRNWPREELLRDVVWIVRRFRPQVIVSVFSGTPRDGHGQHQAAGIVAREAFAVAGDRSRFPDQLDRGVDAWAPFKLFQVSWRRPEEATTFVETGDFDPLLGRSHLQLAMQSRSQHRSQDMGTAQPLGPRRSGLRLIESRVGGPEGQGLFDGIDTTLVGLADGVSGPGGPAARVHLKAYEEAVARAGRSFPALDPSGVVEPLREAVNHLRAAREAAGMDAPHDARDAITHKLRVAGNAILAASGIVVDVRADDGLVVPGESVTVTVQLWNGGAEPIFAAGADVHTPESWTVVEGSVDGVQPGGSVAPGTLARWRFEVTVPPGAELSRLYYLRLPREGALYRWPDDSTLWGLPRDPAPVSGEVDFELGGGDSPTALTRERPWRFVGVDKARGEFRKPVVVVPAVSVAVEPAGMVWPQGDDSPRTLAVALRSYAESGTRGTVTLEAPEGWEVSPREQPFAVDDEGADRSLAFRVRPTAKARAGEHVFRAVARLEGGKAYDEAMVLIDYEHIERAALFRPAESRVTVVPVRVADGLRVGYVMGSGDDGFEAIRQLGVDATLLGPNRVAAGDFSGFDAVVLGVRAYETRPDLRAANDQLLDFARAGGTVVVQYNKYEYVRGGYAPYPVSMGRPAPRVTDEASPVRILEPDAPVFTTPNHITEADFDGWVHERGLYFLREWDARFTPLLELTDFDEEPTRGSLLVAPLGKGVYVYAALSFFRQFPAGVPGAYRLFANLISLRSSDWDAFAVGRGG